MRFRTRGHRRSGSDSPHQSHDGVTYALIEEVRVRYQRLADAAGTRSERASLALAQRELGHAHAHLLRALELLEQHPTEHRADMSARD